MFSTWFFPSPSNAPRMILIGSLGGAAVSRAPRSRSGAIVASCALSTNDSRESDSRFCREIGTRICPPSIESLPGSALPPPDAGNVRATVPYASCIANVGCISASTVADSWRLPARVWPESNTRARANLNPS